MANTTINIPKEIRDLILKKRKRVGRETYAEVIKEMDRENKELKAKIRKMSKQKLK